MIKKSLITLTVSATTALALVACGDSADTQPASSTVEATDSAAQDTITSAEATATEAADEAATDAAGDDVTDAGVDPVFAAIEAVYEQYPDGVIVDLDREDNSSNYDIDVVVGQEVIELKADASTNGVVEDERETDSDATLAGNVAIPVEEALEQALDQHVGAIVDEAELENNNDVLEWVISLDDANGDDLAEVRIQAS